MDRVHICTALYDKNGTYSKYLGTMLCSLLNKTRSTIDIHILHDDTLSVYEKNRFKKMAEHCDQNIYFYCIHIPDMSKLVAIKNLTIGTLFRLKIPERLPASIDKIIYLDADLLVNLDIVNLWDMDYGGNTVLASKDYAFYPIALRKMFKSGLLDERQYFNSGVMVWNLKEIRENYNLYEQAIDFLEKHPESPFLDQDALNYIFIGHVGYISDKYNFFTLQHRHMNLPLEERIYHFAGDHPYMLPEESFDKKFYDVLSESPWREELRNHYMDGLRKRDTQIEYIRTVLKKARGRILAFWGGAGMLAEKIISLCGVDTSTDFIIDNNRELWGKEKFGLSIKSPEVLHDINDVYIIVISNLHYPEIKEQLQLMGYTELEDFVNARYLLLERENGIFVV